jgi:hypothetical protein
MRSPDRGGGVAGLLWTRASGISTPSSTEPSRHSRGRNHTVGVGVAQSRPAVRGELGPPGGCGNRPLCLMDGCGRIAKTCLRLTPSRSAGGVQRCDSPGFAGAKYRSLRRATTRASQSLDVGAATELRPTPLLGERAEGQRDLDPPTVGRPSRQNGGERSSAQS